MNISNIGNELKFANKMGQTLCPEERINLELAVSKLSMQYHYEIFNFWGRVGGIHRCYYIVEGVNFTGANNFPKKQHFWR